MTLNGTTNRKSQLLAMAVSATILTACAGGGMTGQREHDARTFAPMAELAFNAQPGARAFYGTYEGLQGSAVYTAEFPAGWDGDGLVMYTHGYRGTGAELAPSLPPAAFREAVLAAGYAWAASSYSANYYDVRAGIEDTNKLARELTSYLQRDWQQQLAEPAQYLISGTSLGGHTAAAAVERENMQRTLYPVPYAGAAPFCQAEQNQFQWLGDYNRLAMTLAGFSYLPYSEFPQLVGTPDAPGPVVRNLFVIDPATGQSTWEPANINGERLMAMAMNLTGGDRPIFEYGFQSRYQYTVMGSGGDDGTVRGILDRNVYDNADRVYRWTDNASPTEMEVSFNDIMMREEAARGVNAIRNDGVRWLPEIHGDFSVPVLTLHTLGDFYVPFRHQQLYRQGAIRNGNDELLVQRAIRAPGHCDFSADEIRTALSDWLIWVNGGPKPAGDVVLDPEAVAQDSYGCAFTTPDREGLPACSRP